MTMSFTGIRFILLALVVSAFAIAADSSSEFKIGPHNEAGKFLTTAPSDTANTPAIPTLPASSLAEYTTWESLEWMAADCQVIVRATVLDSDARDMTVSKIRVEESIKGGLISGAVLTIELPKTLTD